MKTLTTLCLSLLFAATTFAQTEPGTFSLLPKVGLNLSSLTKSTVEMDMRTGFCGGLELNYQLNKSFSLTLPFTRYKVANEPTMTTKAP